MAFIFKEELHPRGQPKNRGQFISKGGGEQIDRSYRRFGGGAVTKVAKIAKQAAKSFAGGRTTKPIQVFRHITDEFAQTLNGLTPGARISRPKGMATTLQRPATSAMRIKLPKGASASFDPNALAVDLPQDAALRYDGQDDQGNYVFGLAGGRVKPKAKAIKAVPKPEGGALTGMAVGSHAKTISPRAVTAVKTRGEAAGKYLPINIQAMKGDPNNKNHQKAFADNMNLFKIGSFYPGVRSKELAGKTPDEIASFVRDRIRDNLVFLYKNATPEEKSAKTWYVGARRLVDDLVEKYKNHKNKLDDASVAGVFAALSPRANWNHNAMLGGRLIDIYQNQQDHAWDKKMTAKADELWKTPKQKIMYGKIKGKSLAELTDPVEKGVWIRTYDEAHNTREYRTFNPDGTLGDLHKNKDGSFSKATWQTMPNMANAVRALESKGDVDLLSAAMSKRHKVRSFYNNILDPLSDNLDVTVDTHAVGAAWMEPFTGDDAAVYHSLGLSPEVKDKPEGWESAKRPKALGVVGLYGMYADGYRAAAKQLGLRPNELQAIVWTVKQNMLLSGRGGLKEPEVEAVKSLWVAHNRGKTSLEATRKAVMDYARARQSEREARGEVVEDEDEISPTESASEE